MNKERGKGGMMGGDGYLLGRVGGLLGVEVDEEGRGRERERMRKRRKKSREREEAPFYVLPTENFFV